MSATVIHHHPATHRTHSAGRHALLAAVMVLIVGGLGLAIAVSTIDVVRASYASLTAPAPAEPIAAYPVHELPPEWQWSPPSVEYEHMYARKGSVRQDWIRENGSR
jgi:hypothetical protein